MVRLRYFLGLSVLYLCDFVFAHRTPIDRIANVDVTRVKCEMLPYRSAYFDAVCYFTLSEEMAASDADCRCKRIVEDSKLSLETPVEATNAMFLDKSLYLSRSSGTSRKKVMCSFVDYLKKRTPLSAIGKCASDAKVLAQLTAHDFWNMTGARSVVYGPFITRDKSECETACRCASGAPKLKCDCGPFSCSLPSVQCKAFAFESAASQCVLLGNLTDSAACKTPQLRFPFDSNLDVDVVIGDANVEPTTKAPKKFHSSNPKCGAIVVDKKVRCKDDGFVCDGGSLPYLACLIYGQWSFTGGERIHKSGSNWVVTYSTGYYTFSESVAHNITCFPKDSHTYPKCNGNIPRLGNAVILGNAYSCIDGFEWNYAKTVDGEPFSEKPECTHEGWANNGGLIKDKITEMWCRPQYDGKNPKCGPITTGDKVTCEKDGLTCPQGYLPYLACLIDNYWSFTGGRVIYKDNKGWVVESSKDNKWTFKEKDAFNVTCKPVEKHSHDICNVIPRLGNGLIVKDTFDCVDGYDWNYAREKGGESFSEKPECTSQGWKQDGNLLTAPINEMWCKPRSTANSKCGDIKLEDKVYCTPEGYRCADNFLPYLHCYINDLWSYTGGTIVFKSGGKWVVRSSNDEYSFDDKFAHKISCIYNGKPSHSKCEGVVPRFGSAYLAGDTYNCISGFEWNYALEVGKNYATDAFHAIPVCHKEGWKVNGTVLRKPIKEMWCKPDGLE